MKDVNEVFDGVLNAEFKELQLVEGLTDELPVFTLREPSVDEWNHKARVQNTKMFTDLMDRPPVNYQEVITWISSFSSNRVLIG